MALHKNAELRKEVPLWAADSLLGNLYVDDCITREADRANAEKLAAEGMEIGSAEGFSFKPPVFSSDNVEHTKVLGLVW